MTKEKLKHWLVDQNLTRYELGRILGVSGAWVSAWTTGTREIPKWVDFALGEKDIKEEKSGK